MNTTNTLKIGQAYIVDGKPMVLRSVENGRFMFTDGRYGFGRTLGRRASDSEILSRLAVSDVDPQDILDKLQKSIEAMASWMRKKS